MSAFMRAARIANPIAAAVVVALVFVQLYLIADFIFGNVGALNTHMTVGHVTEGVELLVFLTALAGWWGTWAGIRSSAALLLLGALQASFAKDIGNSPGVHALHGMLALAVAGLALSIAYGRRALVPIPAAAPQPDKIRR
jgi:hypothetical protein